MDKRIQLQHMQALQNHSIHSKITCQGNHIEITNELVGMKLFECYFISNEENIKQEPHETNLN